MATVSEELFILKDGKFYRAKVNPEYESYEYSKKVSDGYNSEWVRIIQCESEPCNLQ